MPSPLLADAFRHHVWATIRLLEACTGLSRRGTLARQDGRFFTIESTRERQ